MTDQLITSEEIISIKETQVEILQKLKNLQPMVDTYNNIEIAMRAIGKVGKWVMAFLVLLATVFTIITQWIKIEKMFK